MCVFVDECYWSVGWSASLCVFVLGHGNFVAPQCFIHYGTSDTLFSFVWFPQAVWRLRRGERVPSGGLAFDAHPGWDGPLPAQAVLLLQLRPAAQALRTAQRGVVSTGGAVGATGVKPHDELTFQYWRSSNSIWLVRAIWWHHSSLNLDGHRDYPCCLYQSSARHNHISYTVFIYSSSGTIKN